MKKQLHCTALQFTGKQHIVATHREAGRPRVEHEKITTKRMKNQGTRGVRQQLIKSKDRQLYTLDCYTTVVARKCALHNYDSGFRLTCIAYSTMSTKVKSTPAIRFDGKLMYIAHISPPSHGLALRLQLEHPASASRGQRKTSTPILCRLPPGPSPQPTSICF